MIIYLFRTKFELETESNTFSICLHQTDTGNHIDSYVCINYSDTTITNNTTTVSYILKRNQNKPI